MSRGGGLRPKPEIGNRNVPLHNSNPSLDNPPESRPTREPPRKRDTSPAGTEIQELSIPFLNPPTRSKWCRLWLAALAPAQLLICTARYQRYGRRDETRLRAANYRTPCLHCGKDGVSRGLCPGLKNVRPDRRHLARVGSRRAPTVAGLGAAAADTVVTAQRFSSQVHARHDACNAQDPSCRCGW